MSGEPTASVGAVGDSDPMRARMLIGPRRTSPHAPRHSFFIATAVSFFSFFFAFSLFLLYE